MEQGHTLDELPAAGASPKPKRSPSIFHLTLDGIEVGEQYFSRHLRPAAFAARAAESTRRFYSGY